MLRNHVKIAVRNFLKHQGHSFINVLGLSVGMACCLLSLLYARGEWRYDKFHENANQIYRIALERRYPNRVSFLATTPTPLAATLSREYPEVATVTQLWKRSFGQTIVHHGDKHFVENRVLYADSSFFAVFSMRFLQGNPKTALRQSNAVVITEPTARKYFGDAVALGKVITIGSATRSIDFIVTGIVAPLPEHSHFHFDFLPSIRAIALNRSPRAWLNNTVYTYITLPRAGSASQLEEKLSGIVANHIEPSAANVSGASPDGYHAANNNFRFFLQPLPDIYLHSQLEFEIEPTGEIFYVYFFLAVAGFIMLLACINFVNLSLSRSAMRAKEIGVRKAIGAQRKQVASQFLTESILFALAAAVVSMALVESALPTMNVLAGKTIAPPFFGTAGMLLLMFGAALFVGLIAGSYPAFFLSGLRPAVVLKGTTASAKSPTRFRDALVVFQFAISQVLFTGAVLVTEQIDYIQYKKLGFDKQDVLVIDHADILGQNSEAFLTELVKQPGILLVGAGQKVPGKEFERILFRTEQASEDDRVLMQLMFTSPGFLETLGVGMAAGRTFSARIPTDSAAVILNESAARSLGLEEPLGRRIVWPNNLSYTIIGVVKDFHFKSLHHAIAPLVIFGPDARFGSRSKQLIVVRIRPGSAADVVSYVAKQWQALVPDQPLTYSFLDQSLRRPYQSERTARQFLYLFSAVAIFIACLGLFSLAAITSEQRTKEIGVRKVLGATVANVTALLSKDFVKLVLLANLIAWPVAWYAMHKWLQNFAYRIEISWWIFALAGGLALVIALVTVSTQAIKAALANPVEALRYE